MFSTLYKVIYIIWWEGHAILKQSHWSLGGQGLPNSRCFFNAATMSNGIEIEIAHQGQKLKFNRASLTADRVALAFQVRELNKDPLRLFANLASLFSHFHVSLSSILFY